MRIRFKIKDDDGKEFPCEFLLKQISTQIYFYGGSESTTMILETDIKNKIVLLNINRYNKYSVDFYSKSSKIGGTRYQFLSIKGIIFKEIMFSQYNIEIEATCDYYRIDEISIEEIRKRKLENINGL